MVRADCFIFLFLGTAFSLKCNDDTIRGVNLGGWLLLEPWITPSIFEEVNEVAGENRGKIVDEYTYAQYVDPVFYQERMNRHWDEFYQKSDLEILASVGISHIRIPYGHWFFDVSEDEPYPPSPQNDEEGMRFYLKRMIGWADELGIKVLLDLHGAPGSQNGFDNSGKRGEIHFQDDDNSDRAARVLGQMSELMKEWIDQGVMRPETLAGIEFLNEPFGWFEPVWQAVREKFYYDGYEQIRRVFPDESVPIALQTGFRDFSEYDDYMQPPEFVGIYLDLHEYQCFGDFWNGLAAMPGGWETHLTAACNYGDNVDKLKHPAFTGEFSLEVTDCQKYLDGGYAEPYVPPNASPETCAYYNDDWSTYQDDYKEFLKSYFLAQIDGYEKKPNGHGWYFWTGKTENNCGPEWDFIFLIQQGVIPQDLCNRPTYCNY